jgi:hypothetical protein
LSSSVDASDATYGDVSYDCPPSPIYTISGGGLKTLVDYTTGGVSLPFGTACDWPLGAFDCAVASAGTCGGGGASTRYPNSCSDGACIDVGGGEGECATHFDTFCDGFVSSSGKGIVVCFDNSDCLAIGPSCPGGDCGNCALVQAHECFLDPIAATGSPGAFRVK